MQIEVFQDKEQPTLWRVEHIDIDGEGECFVTIFSGRGAEQQAKAYAEWTKEVNQMFGGTDDS